MVNSGSFDSDVDRNEKGEFTQPRRIAESPQSASSVHAVSGSLCENDFTTQTADSLPPASQAIEPTATKTEYKCSMSDLLLRARKILTSQNDLGDSASRANNDVYYTHETSIVAEGYPTEIGKSEETLVTPKEEDVTKCSNSNKVLNQDEEIKTKVSVCCSVPLEKVQNILKACRSSATDGGGGGGSGDKISFQNRKQISKKDMCLYCDRTFVTSSLKQKHVDRYHSLKYNRRLSARRQVAKHSVTACIFCDKLNNVECSLKELFEHLVTEHPKKYFGCLECETRFPNFQIYDNHNVKIHGASKETTSEQNGYAKNEEHNNTIENLGNFLGTKLEENQEKNETKTLFNTLQISLNQRDEEKNISLKNKTRPKRVNGTKLKKEEEKRKQALPTLSVTLEPIKIFPNDKVSISNENNFLVKDKSNKINWVKELRSKKVSVVSTKMGVKQGLRITRQQNKTLENVKNTKRKVKNPKNEQNNKSTNINTKYLSFQNHPYNTTYDVSFRFKKITDHSIDNIKISSLTFDDVFDKAFFNRVKCNIQENLLNYVDGKLFKSVESENRISSFQKSSNLQLEEPNQNYGCKLSTNVVSPVTTSLLTDAQVGEDVDTQIDCSLKPSKKKGTTAVVNDEVHYKYFTRRKYQAVISENKQHRDLSKLDMWTQLIVKNRQQKIMTEQKTDKEIIEYKKSDEYKVKMQVEELDRILDKRGPLEDLKEEAIRTVALEKLNGTSVDSSNLESYFDVTIILNQLLNSVFTTDASLDVTREDIDNKCTNPINSNNSSSEISQVGEEMPTMLNLRRISYPPQEDPSQKLPNNETDKTVMMELTGEWARSRIYVCAACGIKMPNTKLLIDHKNLFHEHVWCQHYEFVGNQGELYRHLSIPGLGKVGEIESSGSKMWRRSDARVCSKCNKQFNCLGDLHRHVLECGGDWSWMLARKKYKYRPYGSKPRKRRRGLLKFLHTFRERKEQSREKGKPIKKFDGPRQKPSDADTIERMLANLPAKRTTRKIISLKDGLQRSIKNPKISKTNKNTSSTQNKIQTNKPSHKNKDPVVKNSKKSRRLLRSNSNIMFENQMNLILPKYKKERKQENQNDNKIRRHSVRNISRVLSNKLVKANQPVVKPKTKDPQKKILKNGKSIPDRLNLKEDNLLNTNENENDLLTVKKPKRRNVDGLKSSSKKSPDTVVEKATDFGVKKHVKKGKVNEIIKSNPLLPKDESQNVENTEVNKNDHNLLSVKSSKGTLIRKSVSLNNIGESSTSTLKPQLSQSTLDLVSKPLNFLKSLKKNKKTFNKETDISKTETTPSRNKKTKYTFNLRKSKVQHEHKNHEINAHPGRRKNSIRSKVNSASKKIKKAITKIIQVDGSSQNKPSTRSKRIKKELSQIDFLCLNSLSQSPKTTEDIPKLNDVIKIIPVNNSEIVPPDSKLIVNEFLPCINNLSENSKECTTTKIDQDTNIENTLKCNLLENNTETSNLQTETKILISDTNNKLLPTPSIVTAKKKITKKQRGLNDCIAMLTNKLQDKKLQNNEHSFLAPIIEGPNHLTLTDSNKLEEEKSCNSGQNENYQIDNVDIDSSKSFIGSSNNSKNNKENFDSNSILSNCSSCFWERLDKHPVDHISCKYPAKDGVPYENGLIQDCIEMKKNGDKEANNESISQLLLLSSKSDASEHPFNQLEFLKDENRSSILPLIEQLPLPEDFDDNKKKKQDDIENDSKIKSDIAELRETNIEIGFFHDLSQNCGLDLVPKYNRQTINYRKQKIKNKKKNFHAKLQNIRKTVRRCSKYANKHETIKNGTRTEFSNTITDSEISKTTKLIDNEQTGVLSILEEFSNSGKENIKIGEGKLSKHRKIKHGKVINKKKNNEISVDCIGVGDNMLKEIKLDVPIENPLPEITEFVDSDDDIPLAVFAKKSTDTSRINTNSDLEDSLSSESSLIMTNKTKEEIGKDVINSVNSNIDQDDSNILALLKEVSDEHCLPELDEIEEFKQIATERKKKKKTCRKPSKLTVTDKKNNKKKKHVMDIGSESKSDDLDTFNELFIENATPIDFSMQNDKDDNFPKISVRSSKNLATSASDADFPAIADANDFVEVNKTDNLDDLILHKLQENSTDTADTIAENKINGNKITEPLKKQCSEEDLTVDNVISQEENIKDVNEDLINSSVLITSAKSKPRPRLKTVFNNKRNVNGKKKFKPQNTNILNNIYCEICNKTFTRSENLLKHKRTLTHIAKLSELEALQAAEKLKQENTKPSHPVSDNIFVKDLENIAASEYEEFPKNTEISTFALGTSQDSLKLVDIISDVLCKPIDDEFAKPNNFSGLILQSDHETKRCKSLGERKSFDSDKLLFTNQDSPTRHEIDLNQKFGGTKLSNTADIIVEKQISLLENMIEDNRVNFDSSNRIFNSSSIPTNEEYSNQSNSSEFSLLSSSKQEEGNDITFTHNTNIITNLIKPTLDEDNLMQTTQYEEISEDSNSSHFQVEEQKSRKALNRDEELFLECCSLLKSSSDISDLCKKPAKTAQFLNNFGLKPLDEFEWLEQKQLPIKKTADFEYISNNFISDDSRMNVSISDNFYNDLSYSNSNMSNSNLNLKVLLDQNVTNQLFSQPPPIFEDISTESEGSSRKSLGNCLNNISSAIVLNEDVVYDKIKDQVSPIVESAQIPEEHENLNRNSNEKVGNIVKKLSDGKFKAEKNKINVTQQDITLAVPKTTQASIIDYAVPTKIKKNQSKKMLTKGAMKVFEGLKVSIPKDGIDMKEVLSCSPTSKRLQLEAEEENNANKKSCSEKRTKQNSSLNSKIINNNKSIKKMGNNLGLKITKKKFLPNEKLSVKIKMNNITTENENKSHDVYDFEETQDIIDTTFTPNSNSLPNYRSFRNKLNDKSNDTCKIPSSNKKKSEFHDTKNEADDKESDDVYNDRHTSIDKEKVLESPSMEPPSKKIDMCKSITKNKCMIMGRIFKNAVKSKISEEIKNIPAIENSTIVESFVLNCEPIQQPDSENDKEHKLSEEEMNTLFDNLLKEEKSDGVSKKNDEINETGSVTKNAEHKTKHKINRCKKRHRTNSSDFSDEEFSIKKFPKRNPGKKSSKNNECVINLEQELKECIGVASRKSQRKCTSGKQNVLVEYWSSDESSFETDLGVPPTNYLENITSKLEECIPIITVNQSIENKSNSDVVIVDNKSKENDVCELPYENKVTDNIDSNGLKKKTKDIVNKQSRKLINLHNSDKLLKTSKNGDTSSSSFEVLDSQTIASCRRKRTAVDTLYYWSSSSEDELQDVIEVKPIREEYDDEERPLQHGWIVGDSPKKLVTMLAQAKGKKLDVECVKKNKKKRTTV